jgi:hypothetical protein
MRLLCRWHRDCDPRLHWLADVGHRAGESSRRSACGRHYQAAQWRSGFKYTVPTADLAKLGAMNAKLDARGRWDAVMKEDGLFEVEAVP